MLGTPAAFLEYAVQQGFFDQQDLDVQVEPNPGGAAKIPDDQASSARPSG